MDFAAEHMELPEILIQRDGQTAKFHGSWYRGEHTNFIPSKADLFGSDAFDKYVMKGWEPPTRFISKSTPITAFGSCFAANITIYLALSGYAIFGRHLDLQSHIIRFGEGMVSSHAVLQQFQWALEGRDFPANLWISEDKEIAEASPQLRAETERVIRATEVFIITLGLSEIWYDKISGEAFWRAIPASMFDDARHGFRLTSVEENRANVEAMLDLIFAARPDAKVVLTLSPVPLMATFRPVSCVTASAVSKAILRVAIDDVIRQQRPNVFYFPSYEMVTAATIDPYRDDNRHPRRDLVWKVMQTFERHYCAA